MSQTAAAAATGSGAGAPVMTQKGPSSDRSHPVRLYVERVASQDLGDHPEWNLTVRTPLFLMSFFYKCCSHYLPVLRLSLNKYRKYKWILIKFYIVL